MSESAKRIDAIIRDGLAPLLKECGFRKNARNFVREHANRVDVINVQASRWNDPYSARFTVNVGVFYPAIATLSDVPPVHGLPKEPQCTVRERIGLLRTDRKDYWWKVDESTDDRAIAVDLSNQVREVCLPWLDRMSGWDTVKKTLIRQKRAFVAAVVALHQGNGGEAQELFNRALNEQPLAGPRLVAWAKRHGLRIEGA